MILMANDGINMYLQKNKGLLQHEFSQIDSKLDTKLDSRFKDFREEFKGKIRREIKSELHFFFEQYFGQSSTNVHGMGQDRGKGLLGTPPLRFPSKDSLAMSPTAEVGHLGTLTQVSIVDSMGKMFQLQYPRFDGKNFRSWWSKLEQFFEAENVGDQAKVQMVMFTLEGRALNWHYLFAQWHGGLYHLTWELYARALQERFKSTSFWIP